MCVPFPLPTIHHPTHLSPLPNSTAVLVTRLGLVVGMATQQGVSWDTHQSLFCSKRGKLGLCLHLCLGVWYHQFPGGCSPLQE